MIDNATALDAVAVAERLGNLLSHTPVALAGDRQLQITLKTGVAEFSEGDDAAALIGRAFEHMDVFALRRASDPGHRARLFSDETLTPSTGCCCAAGRDCPGSPTLPPLNAGHRSQPAIEIGRVSSCTFGRIALTPSVQI